MLLDGASMWFRAFYGVPSSVTAPDGSPVNAARGFLDHTSRLLTRHTPTDLVCCLDLDWRPQFRVDAIPSYKAHRVVVGNATDTPDELAPQVSVILDVLDAVGICTAGVDGYEADDIIGTLAAQAVSPTLVVTGDRDLFQVIRDGVRVAYTVKKDAIYDEEIVTGTYGLPTAASYADFALLRGDPSDGLPGVEGRRGEDRSGAGHEVRLGRSDPRGDRRGRGRHRRLEDRRGAGLRRRGRAGRAGGDRCAADGTPHVLAGDAGPPAEADRARRALGPRLPVRAARAGAHDGGSGYWRVTSEA